MHIFLAYILTTFFGGIALWLILRLFSNEAPHIVICFISVFLAQLFHFTGIPLIPSIVIFTTLITIGKMPGMPAFFATLLYGLFEKLVIFMVIDILSGGF